jgi:transposase-like protein
MIKHFSKWLEVVPLPNCSNEGATYAFFDKLFSRFGVPAKVFTDQGMEFWGDF